MSKINKYESKPYKCIDLHGYTKQEAESVLTQLINTSKGKHIRIITGKGLHSEDKEPIIKSFTKDFLCSHNISFTTSKIQNGGDGALEVYF